MFNESYLDIAFLCPNPAHLTANGRWDGARSRGGSGIEPARFVGLPIQCLGMAETVGIGEAAKMLGISTDTLTPESFSSLRNAYENESRNALLPL